MEVQNARLGLVLFSLYLILYAIFVYLTAFRPDVMEWTPSGGPNLAILYGFGLIVAAIVLAMIYGWACTWMARSVSGKERGE